MPESSGPARQKSKTEMRLHLSAFVMDPPESTAYAPTAAAVPHARSEPASRVARLPAARHGHVRHRPRDPGRSRGAALPGVRADARAGPGRPARPGGARPADG